MNRLWLLELRHPRPGFIPNNIPRPCTRPCPRPGFSYSLFLEVVYPVVLTEVRLCFMHKIACNSLNVDQIYPKIIDTGIHL